MGSQRGSGEHRYMHRSPGSPVSRWYQTPHMKTRSCNIQPACSQLVWDVLHRAAIIASMDPGYEYGPDCARESRERTLARSFQVFGLQLLIPSNVTAAFSNVLGLQAGD
eukprot:5002287-Amphidinium_carterae.1